MDSFFFLGLFCSLLYEYWSAEFQGSDDEDDEEESSSQPLSSSQTDTSKPASSPLPDSSKIGTFFVFGVLLLVPLQSRFSDACTKVLS